LIGSRAMRISAILGHPSIQEVIKSEPTSADQLASIARVCVLLHQAAGVPIALRLSPERWHCSHQTQELVEFETRIE
jgi:hypothetical protein